MCDYDCYRVIMTVIETVIVLLWLLSCDYDCYCVIMTVVLLWLWARRCGWRIHIDDCYCVVMTVIVLLWLLLCYYDCYCVIMTELGDAVGGYILMIVWLLLLLCYCVIMTVIVLLWLWPRRCGWRIHIDDCYCVVMTVIVLLWLLLCYYDCEPGDAVGEYILITVIVLLWLLLSYYDCYYDCYCVIMTVS